VTACSKYILLNTSAWVAWFTLHGNVNSQNKTLMF